MRIVTVSEHVTDGVRHWMQLHGIYGTFREAYGDALDKLSQMSRNMYTDPEVAKNHEFTISPVYDLDGGAGYAVDLKDNGKVCFVVYILYQNDNENWEEGVLDE